MPKEIVLDNIMKMGNAVTFTLSIDGKKFELNYQFETVGCVIDVNKIEPRLDPIVITLIYHAMKFGYNFRAEFPITNELLYQLTYQFIPQMIRCTPSLHAVEINAPLKPIETVANWVGINNNCDIES